MTSTLAFLVAVVIILALMGVAEMASDSGLTASDASSATPMRAKIITIANRNARVLVIGFPFLSSKDSGTGLFDDGV